MDWRLVMSWTSLTRMLMAYAISNQHVVLHLGFCDMVPLSLGQPVTSVSTGKAKVKEAQELLESLAPAVYVTFSAPVPHFIAYYESHYKIWNKWWRCYNKLGATAQVGWDPWFGRHLPWSIVAVKLLSQPRLLQPAWTLQWTPLERSRIYDFHRGHR